MASKVPQPPRDEDIRVGELVRITELEARKNKDHLKDIPVDPKNYSKFLGEGRRPLPKGVLWGIAGLVLLFIAGFGVSYYILRGHVEGTISARMQTLQAGVQDLKNLDPQSAAQQFSALNSATSSDFQTLTNALGFVFKGGSSAISALTDISGKLGALSGEIIASEKGIFSFLSTGNGGDLAAGLNKVRTLLAAIDADSTQLSAAASYFGGSSPVNGDSYLSLKSQVGGTQNFLDAFIPWFSDPAPHHILLLFQNPSEMRPGGGFLGSYADVTLASSTITGVAVHDIADVDAAFRANIVPPKPLQLEGARWRPADGNWFFDFPTTASETIKLFESSSLYSTTTFDAAIAVTPKIVSDLLAITGPVTIGKPSTTFSADNVVVQIQKIVQAGQATAATYPKAVIGSLATALFEKLASSTDDDKQKLLLAALDWVAKKEVMVYFKNSDIEGFANAYGISGAAYELPQNFNGDYLGIANTDINSDKSEQYIAQDVTFNAVINSDGTETNHLTIARAHSGDTSPYWWYKTANLDYLQIIVPTGSLIENTTGGMAKTIPPFAAAVKSSYTTDPLILTIESSTRTLFDYPAVSYHPESGKRIFSTWSAVNAGASTKLSFDYSHRLLTLPNEGEKYQLIFEKQSGAGGHYKFEINAPLGFKFAENNLSAFAYESNDVPGRLVINLTLTKI